MSGQLGLFDEPAPVEKSPETDAVCASVLPALATKLLDALRIHSVPDHGRCAVGGLVELERQANLILRRVASDRPAVTDERWQAALDALPYYYTRRISINGIN